jgi:DNA-binding LacI/PurR family transcriptional regulator
MTTKRRAPRQSDVAKAAGVSQSAVSRVISGDADAARIPEETRRRILNAIKELGYVPNAAARNLRNKSNRLLGVHTFESVFPHARSDFYFEFLLGIEERAEEVGYDLVLFTSTGTKDGRRRIYRDGTNRLNLADGSVLLGVATDREELARLAAEDYKFVHIGRREVPGADIPCIVPDYADAAGAIVDTLARRGHRAIAYVREPFDQESYLDRRAGYGEAVRRLGLTSREAQGVTDEWLDELVAGPVTAVVAESVRLAEELRTGLEARGRTIPGDLSVAVLEGIWPGTSAVWDCLQVPRKQIGRLAIDALVAMVEDPAQRATSVLVPCEVVPGETIADPRTD